MKQNNSNNGNQTKISLIYRGLNPRVLWQGLVETHINKLRHLASIVAARITLEREPGSIRAFRAGGARSPRAGFSRGSQRIHIARRPYEGGK